MSNVTAHPEFLLVDAFCGFGGTTTGFDEAYVDGKKVAKVIACINHDPKAIKSHWMNHPTVIHFEEDIRTLDRTELIAVVKRQRALFPNAKLIFWASLECTNFSKAKGGKPRDADSRTLAEHLDGYIIDLDPDYIKIENVVEFMAWGPLDENGKPESMDKGKYFERWRKRIKKLGYHDQWKQLNSADFGAYTSRNRLFGCFAKPGLPIIWPESTHCKKGDLNLFKSLDKWKPVKEVLDFDDEGISIFNRKKDLSDRTLDRIFAGLIKYVAKGDKSFIAKYFSGKPEGKVISTNQPAGTITTKDGQSLIQAEFLLKYNSINGKTGVHVPPSVEDPAPVISTQGRLGLVQTKFLQHYYIHGFTTSVDEICPTIRTKDSASLVETSHFIDNQYGKSRCSSIESVIGTITANPKANLVEVIPFIMPTNFSNGPKSIEDPVPVITADRHHHYIVNPSHQGNCTSIDAPCPVIIARQDKSPLYLLHAEPGTSAVPVYDTDSEVMIKIKYFMAAYGLIDIKMRMLRIKELLVIQGFPEDYRMEGTQADKKKFIGNSVHPLVAKKWAEAKGQHIVNTRQSIAI